MHAARYAGDVAGMVLVDATPADYAEGRQDNGGWYDTLELLRELLTPAGLYRAAHTLRLVNGVRSYVGRFLPADQVERAIANSLTRRHRRADAQETLMFKALGAQVRREAHHLGSLPLAVLAGGPKGREYMHAAWLPQQRELCALSTNSTYAYAEHTGHHVQHDDPPLVAQTVRDLVKRVRSPAVV